MYSPALMCTGLDMIVPAGDEALQEYVAACTDAVYADGGNGSNCREPFGWTTLTSGRSFTNSPPLSHSTIWKFA